MIDPKMYAMLQTIRRGLLMVIAAIEDYLEYSPKTADLRARVKEAERH